MAIETFKSFHGWVSYLFKTSASIVVASIVLLTMPQNLIAAVLYQEDFSSVGSAASLPDPWVSINPTQWIENGWLHNQDNDGWPRDSQAMIHDNDPTWRDYVLSARMEPLDSPWTVATLLMRTQGYDRSSAGTTGNAYQLIFSNRLNSGGTGSGPINQVSFNRVMCGNGPCTNVELANHQLNYNQIGPIDATVRLLGDRIALSVDGALIFNIQDPDPLRYGGVGIHNVWESHARYDNFQVSSVPLPAAMPLFFTAFCIFGFLSRRHHQENRPCVD
jgi:hypothetical protein